MKKRFCNFCVLAMLFVATDTTAQMITTVAGSGVAGYSGDGGAATAAEFNNPEGIIVDGAGNIYVAEISNERVRKINTAGIITTFAGNGTIGYTGDGGAATAAEFYEPTGLAIDSAGNVYIADYSGACNCIRKVSTSGIISTIAGGNSTPGYSGDGGPATSAELSHPRGVAIDKHGNIYIAEQTGFRIRKVNDAGIITTVAGDGTSGYTGDGGAATAAELFEPNGVAVDTSGNIYVADMPASVVRKINAAGIISTIAGNGTFSYSGDGGPATTAGIWEPTAVTTDNYGNVYIADQGNNRIRKVNAAGIISTFAGDSTSGFSGDGGPATAAALKNPSDVALDIQGNFYITDLLNQRVRRVLSLPVASIYANHDTVCNDSCITFINTGRGTTDSISWSATGSAIANPHSDTIKVCYSVTGNDTVYLRMYNNSGSDTSVKLVTVKSCATSVADVTNKSVRIYPNPATDEIIIENVGTGTCYTLYNTMGQQVLNGTIVAERQTINVSNLVSGVYFMKLTGSATQDIGRTITKL